MTEAPVSANGEVAVELLGMQRRLRALRQRFAGRPDEIETDRATDRDDECASAGPTEQVAARDTRVGVCAGAATNNAFVLTHGAFLPQRIIEAAVFTARIMPICVAQRHLMPVSASLI